MTLSNHTDNREGRAVVTNGVGQRTTAHLNLTRSLADAWGVKPEPVAPPEPMKSIAVPVMGRPKGKTEPKRIPYAGVEW